MVLAPIQITKKGTKNYNDARRDFFTNIKLVVRCITTTEPVALIERGVIGARCYNAVKDLPLPFGCPELEVCASPKDVEKDECLLICGMTGSLCSPCTTSNDGDFPTHCPEHAFPRIMAIVASSALKHDGRESRFSGLQ
ncbi:MAG: hypothetical protein HY619_01250 [Thaumarchaeota archaeon]|nr:hypothetical protein [Nitrososphaerota archaeon]